MPSPDGKAEPNNDKASESLSRKVIRGLGLHSGYIGVAWRLHWGAEFGGLRFRVKGRGLEFGGLRLRVKGRGLKFGGWGLDLRVLRTYA